jgi:hypothetical protein
MKVVKSDAAMDASNKAGRKKNADAPNVPNSITDSELFITA